jgi:MtaA/CmuA family methyltransferase
MTRIDFLNWIGRRRWLRPVGVPLHRAILKHPLSALTAIAGRRMVTASAGAAAVHLSHLSMERALKDPLLLAEALCFTVDEMGLDTLCLGTDLSLEAEACGCRLRFSESDLPMVVTHPWQESSDPPALRVPDPRRDGRMPVFLEAMRRIGRAYAMIKVAVVTGPFTLATHLRGPDVYLELRMDPAKVRPLLEYCTKTIAAYAEALIGAGEDMIIIAEPAGSLLSPAAYGEFSQAYSTRIINALPVQCILHVCGKTGHIVDRMCQSGAAGLSIDDVDVPRLIRGAPRNVVVIGNLATLTLARGSPDEVRAQTLALLDGVGERTEFIAAPACDVAPDTPLDNIKAFVRTVKGYRR